MPTRAALESKQRILESQLSAAQSQVEEVQRAEKQAAQQFRSKDVRGLRKCASTSVDV